MRSGISPTPVSLFLPVSFLLTAAAAPPTPSPVATSLLSSIPPCLLPSAIRQAGIWDLEREIGDHPSHGGGRRGQWINSSGWKGSTGCEAWSWSEIERGIRLGLEVIPFFWIGSWLARCFGLFLSLSASCILV